MHFTAAERAGFKQALLTEGWLLIGLLNGSVTL
jgi:hypothetical protein